MNFKPIYQNTSELFSDLRALFDRAAGYVALTDGALLAFQKVTNERIQIDAPLACNPDHYNAVDELLDRINSGEAINQIAINPKLLQMVAATFDNEKPVLIQMVQTSRTYEKVILISGGGGAAIICAMGGDKDKDYYRPWKKDAESVTTEDTIEE